MDTTLQPDTASTDADDRATAEAPDDASQDDAVGNDNQFVTFAVAGELFAVPMAPVQEIIRVPEVAHLPLAPRVLEGLANLRGRVLPIVNLRRLFGCDERPHDDTTRALVIHIGQPLGFVVDRVSSVISVEPGEIESADSIQSVVGADFLSGVIKRKRADGGLDMLLVVDFAQLIDGQFSAIGRGGVGAGALGSGGVPANAEQATGDDDAVSSDELRLVSFSVAEQEYALDIAEVQEIVQLPETVSGLPNTPPHVLGVMSLRQRLLPLVSLRSLFGLGDIPYTEQQRIVVTSLPGGQHVGLVTDSVKEVLSVPRAQAEAMPGVLAADQGLQEFSAICRLDGGKRLVSVIDTDRLLGTAGLGGALAAAVGQAASAAGGKSTNQATNQASSHGAAGTGTADTDADADGATTDEEQGSMQHSDDSASDDDTQVVIFRLGAEEFGVPIMSVQEIVRVPETLTRVPKTPAFVEGVINLRGTVLPVIDQRARLGLPATPRSEGQRIMVYLLGGLRTGFIVDSVAEVLRIPTSQIQPAPALSDEQSKLIGRVANLQGDKRLVMLIEPQHLLHGTEMQAVQAMGAAAQAAAPGGSASTAKASTAAARGAAQVATAPASTQAPLAKAA